MDEASWPLELRLTAISYEDMLWSSPSHVRAELDRMILMDSQPRGPNRAARRSAGRGRSARAS